MSWILIANPAFTFPGLEQGIQIGCCQDESPAGSGHAADFSNRLFWVREMFNNMFDNDDTEGAIRKWDFLCAGSL